MKKAKKEEVISNIHASFDKWLKETYSGADNLSETVVEAMKLAFLAGGVAALTQINKEVMKDKESS